MTDLATPAPAGGSGARRAGRKPASAEAATVAAGLPAGVAGPHVRTYHRGMMAYCRLLNRSWKHVTLVLKGERKSDALMARIKAECPELLDLYADTLRK